MGEPTTERCESVSPIYKFDVGPRRCRGKKGHAGNHHALTSDGAPADPQYDYEVSWPSVSAQPAAEEST